MPAFGKDSNVTVCTSAGVLVNARNTLFLEVPFFLDAVFLLTTVAFFATLLGFTDLRPALFPFLPFFRFVMGPPLSWCRERSCSDPYGDWHSSRARQHRQRSRCGKPASGGELETDGTELLLAARKRAA